MTRTRTVFIRADMSDRGGRAGVAHVLLEPLAYLGEVSGTEAPTGCIASAVLDTDADVWQWVAEEGYAPVYTPGPPQQPSAEEIT